MKKITKYFKTLQAVEDFQNDLYDHYGTVMIVDFPRYSEEGEYSWEVLV